MEDLIGIFVLAAECIMAALLAHFVGVALPALVVIAVFVALAFIGLGVWDRKDAEAWGKFTITSVVLGVGFSGADVFLAHLHGQTTFQFRGGFLGLPLTFVTWATAMVCVAGFARALHQETGERRRNRTTAGGLR
jgi:hypothetical protein